MRVLYCSEKTLVLAVYIEAVRDILRVPPVLY
ncbi:hypothetical protein C1752_07507 [Acaryochloris thomasi RCC1774]|uniref:Uncharacterized protein n=1 Tax=Acaryochloris thomasi RCC1774 TaxID=1764569 RepID=A0A2W1JPR1_9CYAN|nr:hypothetical protein C1752_07507 [Acaryochloris thomasi RCC1774]